MSQPFGDKPCMHEALFDDHFLEGTGVTTLDFAKAMIDEGFHPMTMYFPLVVHGAMLIEPTESESKASLDLFIATLRDLAMRAKARRGRALPPGADARARAAASTRPAPRASRSSSGSRRRPLSRPPNSATPGGPTQSGGISVTTLHIKAGPFEFEAVMEEANAPKTCAKFKSLLPYKERIIHVRWSGEGCWIPLGDLDLGLGYENHTSYPAPGEFILYPGGISETEILLAYGGVQLREQGRTARRQPLPDHHQGPREPRRPRQDHPVAGRAGNSLQAAITHCIDWGFCHLPVIGGP